MIDTDILVTGGVGCIATIVSGLTSWFFARKKYNTEVTAGELANLKEAFETYKNIENYNKKLLKQNNEKLDKMTTEVYRLRQIVLKLLDTSCLDSTCIKRQYYTEEQIEDILGEINSMEGDNNED